MNFDKTAISRPTDFFFQKLPIVLLTARIFQVQGSIQDHLFHFSCHVFSAFLHPGRSLLMSFFVLFEEIGPVIL